MLSRLSCVWRRAVVGFSAVLVAFPVSADPGFGGLTGKKKIEVERRQPAMRTDGASPALAASLRRLPPTPAGHWNP